jgi:hypothetical protein
MSVGTPELMSIQSADREGGTDYRLRYRVICTAAPTSDTEAAVRAALTAITVYKGATFTTNTNAVCTELAVDVDTQAVHRNANAVGTNTWHWDANAVFSTRSGTDPASLSQSDPTLWRPKIRIDNFEYQTGSEEQADTTQALNSAGDPMRRERQKAKKLIVMDKNFASYDPAKMDLALPGPLGLSAGGGYLFSRNQFPWNPFAAYAALFSSYQVPTGWGLVKKLVLNGMEWKDNVPYLSMHLEVLVDPNEHKDTVIDEGFRGYATVGGLGDAGQPLIHLFDPRTGNLVSTPVPLDGGGQQLEVGDPLVHRVFQWFPLRNWSAGLGF